MKLLKSIPPLSPGSTSILVLSLIGVGLSWAQLARGNPEDEAWTSEPLRWRLLSDNLHYRGPQLETGVTYSWETEPTNPRDSSGRRLLDGDRPSNWNTTTGWNHQDNAVIFDFQKPFHFTLARLNFHSQAQPKYVEIQGLTEDSEEAGEETWVSLARLEEIESGWNEISLAGSPITRRLRLFLKLDEWGIYFREAQFLGLPTDSRRPADPEALQLNGQLVLAADSKPHVSVVVDREAGEEIINAAWLLRDTLSTMTGAEIPLFAADEELTGPRLIVGPGQLADELGVRVEQEYRPGLERYLIRRLGEDIFLLGNDAGQFRGTAMAVTDFLQRLGCGWFTPDPVYQVIPELSQVAVPQLDIDEQPDFLMRHIWMVKDPLMRDAWRMSGYRLAGGHVLGRTLVGRNQYAEDNPDWFGSGQVCLTHPAVREEVVKEFRTRLDAAEHELTTLSIGASDNAGFCQCENCQAVGNVSARYMEFANAIARTLRESHPGRFKLTFLAYWITHTPPNPMVEGEPEVLVSIVNEGDGTKPIGAPVPPENARRGRNNRREQRAIAGWLQTGSLQGVYEWWIPGCSNRNWRSVPWYSGQTAIDNLRYWQERGLLYLNYETQYEHGDGFPLRWPLYYIGARGTWDASLQADQIMREACAKLFGQPLDQPVWNPDGTSQTHRFDSAAELMFWFYRTLEMAILHTHHTHGNWHLPSPELVYPPEIEARATDYLTRAAEATECPLVQARIAGETKMWNTARATIGKLHAEKESGQVFTVKIDDETWHWTEPEIDDATIRDIAGLAANTALEAIELDGQSRTVNPGESFDLRTGIEFRIIKDEN